MPLLESRRRPHPHLAALQRARRLTRHLVTPLGAWPWPATWAALLFAGLVTGEWNGGAKVLPMETSVRLACLTPLVMVAETRPALRLGAAVLTVALGWCAGGQGSDAEAVSRGVAYSDRWTPSRRRTWRAGACLRVTAWPRLSGGRWRAPAVLVSGSFEAVDGLAGPSPGEGVMISGDGTPPRLWQRVTGDLHCRVPRRAAVPGAFSPYRFLRGRGLVWEGRLSHRDSVAFRNDLLESAGIWGLAPLRRTLTSQLAHRFPPDEARLLQSVLLGERSDGMRSLRDAYAVLGLGHLFAVSGLHVGLVGGILMLLFRLARFGPAGRCLCLIPSLAIYTLLVGMPGSSLRAAALLSTASLAAWAGRRHDAMRTLGLLVWAWSAAEPTALSDAGLRLSFGAAAGILLTLRVATTRLAGRPRPVRWLGNALAVSLGAQLGALPETARSFGWIQPLATSLNVVAVPVFGGAVWLAAGSLLLSPFDWVADALAAVSWLMLRLITAGTVLLSDLAGARIGLPLWDDRAALLYLVGLVGLWRLASASGWGARSAGTLAAACLLALPHCGRTVGKGEMTAVQFDVGQGDCAALVFPDRSVVLIDTGEAWRDTGPFQRDVRPWLRREGLGRLAGVVLTHDHADHNGAAKQVAADPGTALWWLGGCAQAPQNVPDERALRPAPGDTLHAVAPWSLVCVARGEPEDDTSGENDRSLVVCLYGYGRPRGLWTGDLETTGERDLLAHWPHHAPPGLDVLKAGHHGSRTSNSSDFLAALRPAKVLISCGLENRHHHPSHGPFTCDGDTLQTLRTDLDGTLIVRWRDAGSPQIVAAGGP